MNCPRHTTKLTAQGRNGHQLDQCPECTGVWIKGPVIDQILGSGERLKLRSVCSVKESDLLCPVDGHKLHEGKIGPVTVDLCQGCNGLWLDPGELETLLKRKPVSPYVSPDSSVPLNHLDYSLPETILWGLLALTDL